MSNLKLHSSCNCKSPIYRGLGLAWKAVAVEQFFRKEKIIQIPEQGCQQRLLTVLGKKEIQFRLGMGSGIQISRAIFVRGSILT